MRPSQSRWQPPVQPFALLGVLALLILTALAVTSNKGAMRRLGRWWKRLHRLVYLAGGATVAHALVAAAVSKRLLVRDPQAVYEARLAAALLAVLLVVRIPAVRRRLQPALVPLRLRRARPHGQITPATEPHKPPPEPVLPPMLSAAPSAWLQSPLPAGDAARSASDVEEYDEALSVR